MTAPTTDPGEKETGRIEAFSDGVFAIAITLLVLDLKIPKSADLVAGRLMPALEKQWPAYLGYLTSFATILVMWVNHHKMLTHIRRSDDTFLFLNGLLLLFITFVPFPTALVSAYLREPEAQTAAALYAGTYFLIAIAFNLLWNYAARGGRLLARRANLAQVSAITRQYRTGPALYLLAFGLSFLSALASFVLCMLLAIYWSFTVFARKTPSSALWEDGTKDVSP